jgi:hypothetical protein
MLSGLESEQRLSRTRPVAAQPSRLSAVIEARIAEAEAEATAADQATVADMFTNIHAP